MADCYKALLTDEWSCVSVSAAITHLFTWWGSLRIFLRYVRILIWLPCWQVTRYCVILEKGLPRRVGGCSLLSLMYSCHYPLHPVVAGMSSILLSPFTRNSNYKQSHKRRLCSCIIMKSKFLQYNRLENGHKVTVHLAHFWIRCQHHCHTPCTS